MRLFYLIGLGILALGLIIGTGYWGYIRAQPADLPESIKPITIAVTRGVVQQTVTAPGQLENSLEAFLSFKVSGTIAEIAVQPGSTVSAGDTLIHLNTDSLAEALAEAQLTLAQATRMQDFQIAQAKLALQTAQAELAKQVANPPINASAYADLAASQADLQTLMAGPDEDELSIASTDLKQAEILLRQAQLAYDEIAYSNDVGASPQAQQLQEATLNHQKAVARYNLTVKQVPPAELAKSRAALTQAEVAIEQTQAEEVTFAQEITILEAAVAQAQLTLDNLNAGPDPALAQAVQKAQNNLAASQLKAPFTGVILSVSAKQGQHISAGEPVLVLIDPRAVTVKTTIIEEDLPLVKSGQVAEIYFDAEPLEPVSGVVSRIVPRREIDRDRPLYPVYISPGDIPATLIAGMTADASIIIEAREGVLRLPRTLVRAGPSNSAQVNVWHQGQVESRDIEIGLRGDVYVEIIGGLEEGLAVVSE